MIIVHNSQKTQWSVLLLQCMSATLTIIDFAEMMQPYHA